MMATLEKHPITSVSVCRAVMLTAVRGSLAPFLGCPMPRVCSHRSPHLLPPSAQGPFPRAEPVVLQLAVGRMVGVGRGGRDSGQSVGTSTLSFRTHMGEAAACPIRPPWASRPLMPGELLPILAQGTFWERGDRAQ